MKGLMENLCDLINNKSRIIVVGEDGVGNEIILQIDNPSGFVIYTFKYEISLSSEITNFPFNFFPTFENFNLSAFYLICLSVI